MADDLASFSGLLLDIEGTVGPIAFVTDVMFPFVRRELDGWVDAVSEELVADLGTQYAEDAGVRGVVEWKRGLGLDVRDALKAETRRLMDGDVKATGLKRLQGLIWRSGFESGELKAEVFDDVVPTLVRCRDADIPVRIYSSGSVEAQKLFFGHTVTGDLRPFLAGHDDRTTGPKRESASYARIVVKFGRPAGEILFVSDIVAELDAAREAGLRTKLAVRPGNTPQPDGHGHDVIESFDALWS